MVYHLSLIHIWTHIYIHIQKGGHKCYRTAGLCNLSHIRSHKSISAVENDNRQRISSRRTTAVSRPATFNRVTADSHTLVGEFNAHSATAVGRIAVHEYIFVFEYR